MHPCCETVQVPAVVFDSALENTTQAIDGRQGTSRADNRRSRGHHSTMGTPSTRSYSIRGSSAVAAPRQKLLAIDTWIYVTRQDILQVPTTAIDLYLKCTSHTYVRRTQKHTWSSFTELANNRCFFSGELGLGNNYCYHSTFFRKGRRRKMHLLDRDDPEYYGSKQAK